MNKFWYYFRHAVVHPEKTFRQGGQRDRRCLRIDGAELTTIDATLDQAGQEGSIVVEIHFEELVHLLTHNRDGETSPPKARRAALQWVGGLPFCPRKRGYETPCESPTWLSSTWACTMA